MSGWASCADFLFFSFLFYLEILFKSLFAFCHLIEALAAYKCIFRLLSMICLLSITFSSFNTYLCICYLWNCKSCTAIHLLITRNKTPNPSIHVNQTQVHHQQHNRKATPIYLSNQKPTRSQPTPKLNPLLPTLHRLRKPKKAPKICQTINKQKPCDGDIPPSKQIPPRHIHKRLPAHGEIRRVDVSKVRNGQTGKVVAEDLGLGG